MEKQEYPYRQEKYITDEKNDLAEDQQAIAKAFTRCYERYAAMLFRLAIVQLKSRTDAEEVVQEAFIKRLKRNDFNDEDHEKRWLIRVTVNLCHNRYKSDNLRLALPLNETYSQPCADNQYEVMELLASLPEKIRAVFHLYYYEGYKVNEIAGILRMSPSAVKMRLKRGREQLKLEWED